MEQHSVVDRGPKLIYIYGTYLRLIRHSNGTFAHIELSSSFALDLVIDDFYNMNAMR